MAKQTKKAKRTRREPLGVAIRIVPARPASQQDFEEARNLLLRRADSLVLELAKLYQAGKAEELTNVLNAIDCLAEFEGMQRPPA
jgi:hypothetical protein